MKQVVRNSHYKDYIALDFVNEDNTIANTPFYISNKQNIEVHWATPSNERPDNPSEYDDWFERYMFKMEDGKLSVAWLNGPCFGEPDFTEVKPNELIDWRFQYARKIIIK